MPHPEKKERLSQFIGENFSPSTAQITTGENDDIGKKKAKFRGSKVNRAHWKIHHWIIQFLLELLIALKQWHSAEKLFNPFFSDFQIL